MTTEYFTQTEVDEASLKRTGSNLMTLAAISESLGQTRSNVANLATEFGIFKKEFEHARMENAKWKKGVEEKLDLILSHLKCPTVVTGEESQSLLEYGTSYLEKQKASPFVTIKYLDGRVEDVVFNEKEARDIMSGTSQREVVRKLLLLCHGNNIALLRRYSLTGKTNAGTSRKRTWTDTDDILRQVNLDSEAGLLSEDVQVKMALPLRTVLIIQESIRKLFPVDQMLFDVNPKLAAKQVEKLEHDVRGYITAVLNYFSCKYDVDGKIIISPKVNNPPKKPRRILNIVDENNEIN